MGVGGFRTMNVGNVRDLYKIEYGSKDGWEKR